MNTLVHTPANDADDADMVFADDTSDADSTNKGVWKVLIADDEVDVHEVTKVALSSFSFQGRGIRFLDAYTGAEACDLLRTHPDTAVVLMDVVMESKDAGLKAIQCIREEIGNHLVRIILRTGQPGSAPERDVVLGYHINDYKEKTELTSQKLFTALVAGIRSFQDLQALDSSRRGLLQVLDSSSSMDFRSRSLFVSGLLLQLESLLDLNGEDLLLIRRAEGSQRDNILAACGDFAPFVGELTTDVFDRQTVEQISESFATGVSQKNAKWNIQVIPLPDLDPVVVVVGGGKPINEAELTLLSLFCLKIVLACDNFEMVEEARLDQTAETALLTRLGSNAAYLSVAYATHRGRLSRDIAAHMRHAGVTQGIERRLPEMIERAAMLADVGNFHIPSDILQGAGPLSATDRALVQQHPQQGAALIDDVLAQVSGGRMLHMARDVALSHHERWDGSGYPAGLRGDAIPLAARIVAVADSYLAMTSERPWRSAWSHADAVEHISKDAAGQFDPQVLEAFLAVCDAYRLPD